MSVNSSSSPQRMRMSRAECRGRLIRVTRQLFGIRDYSVVSVEEIVSAAGVSKPIVYERFEGKEGLYWVIVDHKVKALSDILRSQMCPKHSTRAVLEGIVVTLLDFIEESADGFHLLVHQSPTAVKNETFETVMADIAGQVTIFLALLLEERGLDPMSAPVYGQILADGVGQTGQWWSENVQVDGKLVTAQVMNLLYPGFQGMEKDPQLQTH